MMSRDIFRSYNSTPQSSSSTFLRSGDTSILRQSAIERVEFNKKPKVGCLDSSQRTYISAVSNLTNKKGNLIQPHTKKNVNTVNNALHRVRNAGCVPPLKCSAQRPTCAL